MELIGVATGSYYQGRDNNYDQISSVEDDLTEMALQNIFLSTTDNGSSIGLSQQERDIQPLRPLLQEATQPLLKQQKIVTQIRKIINLENDAVDRLCGLNAAQNILSAAETTESFYDMIMKIRSKIEGNEGIKNRYILLFLPCFGYYHEVSNKELKGLFTEASQLDCLEVQKVLGTTQGETWWIRRGFLHEEEVYKGIVYLNGTCSHCVLHTNNDLMFFFNSNSSVPDLETLRKRKKERTDEIKKEYILQPHLEGYYKNAFLTESNEIFNDAVRIDSLEVQAILGTVQGEVWWIRKGFYNGQEVYKGIIYLNGECSYSILHTDDDVIDFVNKNLSIPDLEVLRREKIEKVNKIKKDYIAHCSSSKYYKSVFELESKKLFHKSSQLAISEAKFVLGGTQGRTWWIQKDFSVDPESYNGIVYLDGECSYYRLSTDNDLIDFVNKNSPSFYLEALRRERINKIKDTYIDEYSSNEYYKSVFELESKKLFHKSSQLAISEARSVLGGIQGEVWWIQKTFSPSNELYSGVIYSNEKCLYYKLSTDDDLIEFINFVNEKYPNLYLETLRIEKINKIKNEYAMDSSFGGYYQAIFELESKGLFDEAYKRSVFEAMTVLGTQQGITWWIQKGFHNGQAVHKGITYMNGKCFHYILPTERDLISFFNKNCSYPFLEALRKGKTEKVNKIKNEYTMDPSSGGYYEAVFNDEDKRLLERARQRDILEAQSVLRHIYSDLWWIRKGVHDGQEVYKGIVYSNGQCIQYLLNTDNDLIYFFNSNSSIPYLEKLRNQNYFYNFI